jgi:signal transduction histidine kinase
MSIVKQAVDLHGGEIFVESAIGAGTTFTQGLPLQLFCHFRQICIYSGLH